MSWLKRNFWEIHRSSSLGVLGALIAVGQILTLVYWRTNLPLGPEATQPLLCWSFQTDCSAVRLSGSILSFLVVVQLLFSALATILFLIRRSTGLAWFGLFFGWLLQLTIYLQDAGLRSNPIAFVFLLTLAFLFLPNKSTANKYLFFSYFILDALTKINADWLSGLGFIGQLSLPPKGLEWIAAFSVLIQIVMPFFLMCRDGQRLGYGFSALFLYQLTEFFVLKDYGHLVIGILLIAFIFRYFENKRLEIESMYQSYEHPEPSHFWWPIVVGSLVGAQFLPKHILPQIEVLQLQKIQTAEECQTLLFSYTDDKMTLLNSASDRNLPPSLKCNAQANFNSFKQMCLEKQTDPKFRNLTVFFLTRGMSDFSYRVRFGSDNFCDSSYTASRIGGFSL